MDEARKGAGFVLFQQYSRHIGVRVAGMDDDRKAGFPGRPDMGAEAFFLEVAGAVVVVEIEARFAEADDLRVGGHAYQVFGRHLGFVPDIMGMDADGAEDVVVFLGDGEHAFKRGDAGADGQHVADPGLAGAGHDGVEFVLEIGEIQVAVAVDQHYSPSPAFSSS